MANKHIGGARSIRAEIWHVSRRHEAVQGQNGAAAYVGLLGILHRAAEGAGNNRRRRRACRRRWHHRCIAQSVTMLARDFHEKISMACRG